MRLIKILKIDLLEIIVNFQPLDMPPYQVQLSQRYGILTRPEISITNQQMAPPIASAVDLSLPGVFLEPPRSHWLGMQPPPQVPHVQQQVAIDLSQAGTSEFQQRGIITLLLLYLINWKNSFFNI